MMKKITDIFREKKKTFSLELFPPKTPAGYEKLLETTKLFAQLDPDFVSCTYGAGGGNREKTLDIVEHVQREHHIPGVAHLTCVLNTQKEIQDILEDLQQRGINNVLALRGDPPQDNPRWQPTKENFCYAYELCAFIKERYQDFFSIGVAGFPEGHVLCPDRDLDARYLKIKIDSGADYVVTQLFFNNQDYFDYAQRLRQLGVTARVLPGILPITNFHAAVRFCKTCATTMPQNMIEIFQPIADDPEETLKQGIRLCVQQCRELLQAGAPGIHFYPLNKIYPLNAILPQIKDLL